MAYYAWSEIRAGDKSAKPGDQVDAAKLGLEKEQFEELVESGSVREEKFPDLEELGSLSPTEAAKRDLAIAAGQIEAEDVEGAGVKDNAKDK